MSIGFSCPMALPVFEPNVDLPFGGSEVRAYRFATGLASLGRKVDVLVNSEFVAESKNVSGVAIHYHHRPCRQKSWRDQPTRIRRVAAWPVAKIRRLTSRFGRLNGARHEGSETSLYASLDRVASNVWAAFGVHQHSAQVIRYAKQKRLPSLLFLASDTDLSPDYLSGNEAVLNAYGQNAADCLFALNNATAIVAQTEVQQAQLASMFGRSSTLIRNPICVDRQPTQSPDLVTQPYDVLWIGRADCFSKRADLAIEIAKQCPQHRFLMIMNQRDPRTFRRLIAKTPRNVQVLSKVPWRNIGDYFASARLLLNTSDAEGFPNTFLEAAATRVPIASLKVDPGQMLSEHGCGYCADGNLSRLVEWIGGCLANTSNPMFQAMRDAARRYAQSRHSAEQRCAELDHLLMMLLREHTSTKQDKLTSPDGQCNLARQEEAA